MKTRKVKPTFQDVCLNEKLYIIPEKIHLTIAPLWLLTEEDERRARACLDNVVAETIKCVAALISSTPGV